MSTYIILGRYNREGAMAVKDHPKRLAEAQKLSESLGAKIKDFSFTLGQYDFVLTAEAPNEEVLLKILFIVGSVGAIKTETLVAISGEKGAEIIKGLP